MHVVTEVNSQLVEDLSYVIWNQSCLEISLLICDMPLVKTVSANLTSCCGNYIESVLQWQLQVGFVRIGSDFKKRLILNLKEWLMQSSRCRMQVIQPPPVKVSQVSIPKAAKIDLLIREEKIV